MNYTTHVDLAGNNVSSAANPVLFVIEGQHTIVSFASRKAAEAAAENAARAAQTAIKLYETEEN